MTEGESLEIFRGFPIHKREREIMDNLLRDANRAKIGLAISLRPSSKTTVSLFNLIGRGWVIRTERANAFSEETYAVTLEGERALKLDNSAIKAGLKRNKYGSAISAYQNLSQRLALINISN